MLDYCDIFRNSHCNKCAMFNLAFRNIFGFSKCLPHSHEFRPHTPPHNATNKTAIEHPQPELPTTKQKALKGPEAGTYGSLAKAEFFGIWQHCGILMKAAVLLHVEHPPFWYCA